MDIASTISELQRQLAEPRRNGKTIGFAPTMGNLHAGHARLIAALREHCDYLVVSIFVNPTQFAPNEDIQLYPRTPEADRALLSSENVDLLFCPSLTEIYPSACKSDLRIDIPSMTQLHCGRKRPNHFSAVLTIVNLLFNLVRPQRMAFGKKDFQQLRCIERMVADLHLPVMIDAVDTGRASDGLALSSRNQYLTIAERQIAPQLYQHLQRLVSQIKAGARDFRGLEKETMRSLATTGWRPEYCAIVCPFDLQLAENNFPLMILIAAVLGKARLIDNIEINYC